MAKIRTGDTLAAAPGIAPGIAQGIAPGTAQGTAQGRAPGALLLACLRQLMLWRWRRDYRRELSTLSARQMHDAGLDADVVRRESNKPFWEA
jgi:uncharacterized protein YjiS (DUF1127 family)